MTQKSDHIKPIINQLNGKITLPHNSIEFIQSKHFVITLKFNKFLICNKGKKYIYLFYKNKIIGHRSDDFIWNLITSKDNILLKYIDEFTSFLEKNETKYIFIPKDMLNNKIINKLGNVGSRELLL